MKRWSQEQGQRPPYGMEKGFYKLDRGRLADRDLRVMVRHIARHGKQARASANQIMEVGATTEVTAVRLRCLDKDLDRKQYHTETLYKEVTATRAEIREYRER